MKPRVLWPRYLDLPCGFQPPVAFFFAGRCLFFIASGFVVAGRLAMP